MYRESCADLDIDSVPSGWRHDSSRASFIIVTEIARFKGISTIGASLLVGLSFLMDLGTGGIAAMLHALAAVVLFIGMSFHRFCCPRT